MKTFLHSSNDSFAGSNSTRLKSCDFCFHQPDFLLDCFRVFFFCMLPMNILCAGNDVWAFLISTRYLVRLKPEIMESFVHQCLVNLRYLWPLHILCLPHFQQHTQLIHELYIDFKNNSFQLRSAISAIKWKRNSSHDLRITWWRL